MSILATRVIAPHQRLYAQLVCGRCGIEHEAHPKGAGAAYCFDCRPEALRLGWYERGPRREEQRAA